MAKIFLDTNKLVDIVIRKPEETARQVTGHELFVSPLSCHILYYLEKVKVPNKNLAGTLSDFEYVNFDNKILESAMEGPTSDLEDNIQLHSAAKASCDFFWTNDKKLLKRKQFKKTKIMNKLINF